MAREHYGVEKVIARVNDPRNQPLFDLTGITPTVSATSIILAMIEHEVPEHGLIHLLELRKENLEIVEVQLDADSPSVGKQVSRIQLPTGSRLITVMRDGQAQMAEGEIELGPATRSLPCSNPARRKNCVRSCFVRGLMRGFSTLAVLGALVSRDAAADRPRPISRRPRPDTGSCRSPQASSRRCTSLRRATSAAASTSSSRKDGSGSSRTAGSPARCSTSARRSSAAASRDCSRSPSIPATRNGKYYVNYTDRGGDSRVVEYRGRRRLRQLMFWDDPYSNHNGGQNAFGPDGRLYVGMGDAGAGGDPEPGAEPPLALRQAVRAQRRPGARRQIVGYGLRNPWRFSFDRATGDLYIGDVGQNSWRRSTSRPGGAPAPRELRLGRLRGPRALREQAVERPGQARPPGRRLPAQRRALRRRWRLRLPRERRPCREGTILLRRQLLGHGLELSSWPRAKRSPSRSPSAASLHSARTPRRSSTRSRSTAASISCARASPLDGALPAGPTARGGVRQRLQRLVEHRQLADDGREACRAGGSVRAPPPSAGRVARAARPAAGRRRPWCIHPKSTRETGWIVAPPPRGQHRTDHDSDRVDARILGAPGARTRTTGGSRPRPA